MYFNPGEMLWWLNYHLLSNRCYESETANGSEKWYHAMRTYWGVDVELHAFLTSALDGGEWSGSSPGRFTPEKTCYPLDRRLGRP